MNNIRKLILLFCIILGGSLTGFAQDIPDPTPWDNPYGSANDSVEINDPIGWANPYATESTDKEDMNDPSIWSNPYGSESETDIVITDQGLPACLSTLQKMGTAVDVRVKRRLVGGMFNTLCLPFSINDISSSPLAGSRVAAFTSAEVSGQDLSVYFEDVDYIVAGVPYLIQPETTIEDTMDFSGVVIEALSGSAVTSSMVDFKAVMEPYDIPVNEQCLMLGANNTVFYSNGDGTLMPGLRAFFEVKQSNLPAVAPRAKLVFGRQVPTTNVEVNAIPSKTRVLLKDGNIIIQRNGNSYTITGAMIE